MVLQVAVPMVLVQLAGGVFRIARNPKVMSQLKKYGATVIKEVPKSKSGKLKPVKTQKQFEKLLKEREPSKAEQIGNMFVRRNRRVKKDSPGRTNVREGINTGVTRVAGRGRGEQVKGAVKGVAAGAAGAVGVGAIVKTVADKRKERIERAKAKRNKPLPRPKNITEQKTTTIRKGDTYTSLAKRYDTTVKKLRELNPYTDTKLPIGKTIKLR
jgi:LysM repeat protein